MNWAWTVAAIVGSWLAMVCLLLVVCFATLRLSARSSCAVWRVCQETCFCCHCDSSMELLLPVWRAPPAVTAAAAAAMGLLAMQRVWLMVQAPASHALPSHNQPVTRNTRYSESKHVHHRIGPSQLDPHTPRHGPTLSGNDLHLAMCCFQLQCLSSLRSQWRH